MFLLFPTNNPVVSTKLRSFTDISYHEPSCEHWATFFCAFCLWWPRGFHGKGPVGPTFLRNAVGVLHHFFFQIEIEKTLILLFLPNVKFCFSPTILSTNSYCLRMVHWPLTKGFQQNFIRVPSSNSTIFCCTKIRYPVVLDVEPLHNMENNTRVHYYRKSLFELASKPSRFTNNVAFIKFG